jgi:D-alanyl-lipoteichoic acid acyltransferase DltB (MBOAT superfamily)
MLFNSVQFALFFVLSVGLLGLVPHRYRWMLLLVASYYFYMCWKVEYGLILFGITLMTYLTGLQMAKCRHAAQRKKYLIVCLLANLGALFFFKYFNFFSRSLTEALHAWNLFYNLPALDLLLPVGISFYIFQSVGYAVDVYRGRTQAETHPGFFALFVAFWPQLLAGPIGRANHLLPQLKKEHQFEYSRVIKGLRLMLWGLVKKVVIADHLAIYVSRVYDHLPNYQGFPLMIATVFYTAQIYCDFSGYTDVARGAARVMGYDLMENFRRPYFAKSMREFWQRWHISLSTWFRDYVYIPLGGRRVAKWRWYYNLFLTFLLSGLWHGANWTFVIWGAFHGGCLILEYVTGGFQERVAERLCPEKGSVWHKGIQVGLTLPLVCFSWIFFRPNSAADAFYVIGHMLLLDPDQMGVSVVEGYSFLLSIVFIMILIAVDLRERKIQLYAYLDRWPLWMRWSLYSAALWAVLLSTVFGVKQEYIYFQF